MITSNTKSPRIFFGWWIIFGGLVGMALNTALNYHGLNVFVRPLADGFGVSVAAIAALISFGRIEGAFFGPIEGYLVDKLGPRTLMFFGIPLMGLGFILASFAPNFPIFCVVFLIGINLGSSIGFMSSITTAVANWWNRHRGRAFGFMWLGLSIGAVTVPLTNALTESLGWRGAFRVLGVGVMVIGLPIATLMRHKPEQYGMLPDGAQPAKPNTAGLKSTATQSDPPELTVWEALKTTAFWYFAIAVSIRIGVTSAVGINSFLLVESLGGTTAQAGSLFVIHGIFSAPGRLFLSWAGDVINKSFIMAGSLVLLGTCLLFIARATSFNELIIFWIPYALAWGGLSSLPQSLRADLFGREHYATIQGAMSPIHSAFTLVTPIMAAWMFESTGSYQLPFTIFAISAFFGGFLILLAKPPVKPPITPIS